MVDYEIVKYILIGYWALLIIIGALLLCKISILLRKAKKNYDESIEALKFANTCLEAANQIAEAINEPLTSEEN